MNVVLNPELEKLVHEKIGSGAYETPEAVVESALRLLLERDKQELSETREAVQRALEQSARGEPASVADRVTDGPEVPSKVT